MSSSRVLIVPIIAALLIGAVIVILALWVAYGAWRRNRAQYLLASEKYEQMAKYARDTDDLVCSLINEIEAAPATADTLLSKDVQQGVYSAHSQFRELRSMKGIK